jgi:hypothetical protein
MRRLALFGLLALTACGPVKNLDPLGGLGGPDTSKYGFETSAQGWACASEAASSCFNVGTSAGRSLYGQGSLAVALFQMGNHYSGGPCVGGATDNLGRISVDLSASPLDLRGKTVTAWVYLPAAAQAASDAPTQAQIYMVDGNGAGIFANGSTVNLKTDNWSLISFRPFAWAGPGINTSGGIYVNPGFDPSSIKRLGIKFAASGAAPCDFVFSGTVLVDSINW